MEKKKRVNCCIKLNLILTDEEIKEIVENY